MIGTGQGRQARIVWETGRRGLEEDDRKRKKTREIIVRTHMRSRTRRPTAVPASPY